jgi:hypothetical protein
MLTPGEFVVNRAATQANLPLLKSINRGQQLSSGGVVYAEGGALIPYRSEYAKKTDEARKAYEKEMKQRKYAREKEMFRRSQYSNPTERSINENRQMAQQAQQPQQQSIPPISPQTQQRVGMAAQAAFDPKNSGDMNKQLVIFGTLLTGVNQVITQFGAVMQQLVAGAGQAGGGVNNSGQGTPSTDGISQFTTSFNNFVNQLQKLNIPEQINISLTQTKPIDVNINGADALQQLLGGPLGEMIKTQVAAALNQRDINDEKPAS